MKTQSALISLVAAVLVAACSGPAATRFDDDSAPFTGEPRPGDPARPFRAPGGRPDPQTSADDEPCADVPAHAAAWTEDGMVVVFDTQTGAIVAQAEGGGLGGEKDVAWDPWQGRLLTFEGDAEDQWGEVASYPLSGGATPVLGSRDHQVWIDGIARVTPSPFGAVIFEESYGPRWRLVSAAGGPTPSVAIPRPRSFAFDRAESGELWITALTYGFEDTALDVRVTAVLPGGVQAPQSVTPVSAFPPPGEPEARWAESPEGAYLAAPSSGGITLSHEGQGGWTDPVTVLEGGGIERVEAFSAPAPDTVAALVSGGPDLAGDLVIVRLTAEGEVECAAEIDLPGTARKVTSFFSRDLVAVGPTRVLAATSSGVVAVEVPGACPMSLAVDAAFDGDALRGPMSASMPPL